MTTGYFEVPNNADATALSATTGTPDHLNLEVRSHRSIRWQRRMTLVVAASMAVIFALDTFALLHTAVSVLYIACLMLVSIATGNHRVLLAATIVTALLLLSYAHNHGGSSDPASIAILASSLAGVWMTCAWTIWSGRVGDDLEATRLELARNRELYRTVFDASTTVFFEQDFSSVRAYLMELKAEGVNDLRSYGQVHPEYLITCISKLRTNRLNNAALRAVGNVGFTEATFVEILEVIFNQRKLFKGLTTFAHSDEKFELSVVFPDDERMFSTVLVELQRASVTQPEAAIVVQTLGPDLYPAKRFFSSTATAGPRPTN